MANVFDPETLPVFPKAVRNAFAGESLARDPVLAHRDHCIPESYILAIAER